MFAGLTIALAVAGTYMCVAMSKGSDNIPTSLILILSIPAVFFALVTWLSTRIQNRDFYLSMGVVGGCLLFLAWGIVLLSVATFAGMAPVTDLTRYHELVSLARRGDLQGAEEIVYWAESW